MENKSIKILLVEDNASDAELIGIMLDKASFFQFELVAVEQLSQALQQLEDEQFDVILLDLSLPDSQGFSTFDRIHVRGSDVPIILMTGFDDETFGIQTVQAGAQDYLVKGQMSSHLLVRAIRYAVERHQLNLELKESEARLRIIIENNADGIVVVNQAGITQFANPSAETLFGRSVDELMGKPFDFPITTTEVQEFNIIRRNDQIVTVEMRVVETEWTGEFAYLVSLRDITERKQVEETLQDNLQQLEIAYEQATVYAQELTQEIAGRKRVEKALRDAHDELEIRVLERTMDLSRTNEALQNEIKERQQMEDLLCVQRDLGLATNADPRLDETLRLCLDAAIRVSGMDCGGIYLVEEDSGDLELVFHQGFPADFIKSVSHYAADSVNAHLVVAGKPIYTQHRDLGAPLGDAERRENLRAIAIMPVHHQGRVIACLDVASHTADKVPDFGRTALETIVTQIGGAIAHARAVEALWKSEERYALAARGANDGLWDWDIKTNQVYFSPRWKSMLGYEENEIGDSPDEWFNRIHPEDLEKVKAAITVHREGRLPHLEHEHRMLHRDGAYRWMLSRGLAVRDATGQIYRMAGWQTDITKRKQTEAKLIHDAFYDPLTELPNRVFFIDQVKGAIQKAKEGDGNYLFAVLFLDLDRFKIVNDSLGHLVGDELLIAAAARLLICLKNPGIVARFGGDEFAILLEDIEDISDATQVADRVQKQMALPFEVSEQTVFTTVSIGITPSTIGYDQPEDCLRDADTAMYQAKANGRARYEIFNPDMHTNALSIWQLDADLRRATERREFEVYYQPIVSLASGQITGAEALLRWQHPQRGRLDPAEFLSLAEETGLIMPIGEWVLRQVCVHNKAWQANGGSSLSVAVNLSARQFQHQDLPNLIKEVLHETGLTTQALVLEVTESVATKNIDPSLATLHELSAMGIKISIDDFGIGSALDCLKRFPLNNLKIDQSFVKDIINDKHNAAITRAIIDMAHSLDLTVIAEGVETEEQLAFLRSYQCDQIQGYLFSRPMPAEEFAKLLQQGWQLTIDRGVESI